MPSRESPPPRPAATAMSPISAFLEAARRASRSQAAAVLAEASDDVDEAVLCYTDPNRRRLRSPASAEAGRFPLRRSSAATDYNDDDDDADADDGSDDDSDITIVGHTPAPLPPATVNDDDFNDFDRAPSDTPCGPNFDVHTTQQFHRCQFTAFGGVSDGASLIDVAKVARPIAHGMADDDALRLLPPLTKVTHLFDFSPAEHVVYAAVELTRLAHLRILFAEPASFPATCPCVPEWLRDIRAAAEEVPYQQCGGYGLSAAQAARISARVATNGTYELRIVAAHDIIDIFKARSNFAMPGCLPEFVAKLLAVPPMLSDCSVCLGALKFPIVLQCGHVFCEGCVYRLRGTDEHPVAAAPLCPVCRRDTVASPHQKFVVVHAPAPVSLPPSPEDSAPSAAATVELPMSLDDARKALAGALPSRVTFTIELICSIAVHDADLDAKFVIFSASQSRLEMLRVALEARGVECVCVFTREDVARHSHDFRDPVTARARVCLLHAGASSSEKGLALTAANHVILLEFETSAALADQAMAPVRRLWQTRPVTVHRLAARGTIQARLQRLVDHGKIEHGDAIFERRQDGSNGYCRCCMRLACGAMLGNGDEDGDKVASTSEEEEDSVAA